MSIGLEKIFEIASQKLAREQEAAAKVLKYQKFISTLRKDIETAVSPVPRKQREEMEFPKQGIIAHGIAKSFTSDKSDLSAQIFIGMEGNPITRFVIDPLIVVYTQVVNTLADKVDLDPKIAVISEAFIVHPKKIERWNLKNEDHHDLPVDGGSEKQELQAILNIFNSQNQV